MHWIGENGKVRKKVFIGVDGFLACDFADIGKVKTVWTDIFDVDSEFDDKCLIVFKIDAVIWVDCAARLKANPIMKANSNNPRFNMCFINMELGLQNVENMQKYSFLKYYGLRYGEKSCAANALKGMVQ